MRKFERCHDKNNQELNVTLPTRADNGSAGYDFYSPIDFTVSPQQTIIIQTGVKVCMESDEVLLCFVRSSIGIKKQCVLANGTGVIDSTYYNNPDNEGNICIALTNIGNTTRTFNKNDRIMQGVFVKYLTTDNDKALSENRTGGIGSTGV